MSQKREVNSCPDGYRVLSTSELRELLQDEAKMDKIVRLSEKFQELHVERGTLLATNRSLAEENLALQPRLHNGKLNLAAKYEELAELTTSHRNKQSRLGLFNEPKKTGSMENMAAAQKDPKPAKPLKKESQPLIIAKSPADEQRLKVEKLMRNPDKPATIPERPKEWTPRSAPEFVRDVMGSSAGAGSGEFHVYRHLRRREYQRQDFLDRMSEKQKMDEDYKKKIKENQQAAVDRTAKRRKKREKLKKKKWVAKKARQESRDPGEPDNQQGDESSESGKEDEDVEEMKEREDDAEEPSFVMGKM